MVFCESQDIQHSSYSVRKDIILSAEVKNSLEQVVEKATKLEGSVPERRPFQDRLVSDREEVAIDYAADPLVKKVNEIRTKLQIQDNPMTLKVHDGSFHAIHRFLGSDTHKKTRISTVYTAGPVYKIVSKVKRIFRTGRFRDQTFTEEQTILKNVHLHLKPGKTYLVLGAPRSGKSSLLKLIAGRLPRDSDHSLGGTVTLNQYTPDTTIWSNFVGYIDQIDRLHPFLTVKETCDFAWQCRTGGTHWTPLVMGDSPEITKSIAQMDQEKTNVDMVLQGVGLKRVSDTFVGDQETVRGVSGGEKKRVTLAEMAVGGFPVLCADEISTGLDGKYECFIHPSELHGSHSSPNVTLRFLQLLLRTILVSLSEK